MTRRCDRCRTEYESGVDYGGKDYCMTCYVRVKQEDERKRRDEERKREQREEDKRKLMHEQLVREYEERRRAAATYERPSYGSGRAVDERTRREIAEGRLLEQQKPKKEDERKKTEEEMRKRYAWDTLSQSRMAVSAKPKQEAEKRKMEFSVGLAGHSPEPLPPLLRPRPLQRGKIEEDRGGYFTQDEGRTSLSLAVQSGLPVSLSVGQKDVAVALLGKNNSAKRVGAKLLVLVAGSKGRKLEAKSVPAECFLDAGGQQSFEVKFDLREDTPTGPLAFSAHLQESAIYLDHEAGRSETVQLASEVKTPLDLEYRRGSAAFEQTEERRSLILVFDNRGESGGLLSKKSGVTYGEDKERLYASLLSEAKIKGKQKNVRLKFAAQKSAPIEKLSIELVGVDSNGKPYLLKKTIKEKKGKQAPDGI